MPKTQKKIYPDSYLADKFVALRAYYYWLQRGCPFGSPIIDWFKAVGDISREMTLASGMTETEMQCLAR